VHRRIGGGHAGLRPGDETEDSDTGDGGGEGSDLHVAEGGPCNVGALDAVLLSGMDRTIATPSTLRGIRASRLR